MNKGVFVRRGNVVCVQCGYCCVFFDVVIVKPEYAEKDLVVDFSNFSDVLIHKPYRKPCPHLEYRGGKYFCKVHDFPWYKDTPCAEFTQIESQNSVCRLGERISKDEKMQQLLWDIYNAQPFQEK